MGLKYKYKSGRVYFIKLFLSDLFVKMKKNKCYQIFEKSMQKEKKGPNKYKNISKENVFLFETRKKM